MTRLLAALLLTALLLAGCGAEPAAEELIGVGGGSPQQVVESFLEDLNEALSDQLDDPDVRRAWAERLASHFAPSERADQRASMATMLAGFAASAASPAVGSRATLELSWTRIDLVGQDGERARVRVVDGVMTLRFLNEEGEVIRERSAGITDVIGQEGGWLPALRVGTSWFMTEG